MTDVAQEHATQPSATQPPRPTLEVVPNAPVTAPTTSDAATRRARSEEPNIGRSAMIGAVIGFFAVMIAITVVGALSGVEPGSAFGMGCFVGFWGGGGFGFMMGGTIPFARHLDAVEHARSTDHGQGDTR